MSTGAGPTPSAVPVPNHADGSGSAQASMKDSGAMLTIIKTNLPPPVVRALDAFDSHPAIANNLAPLTSDEPGTAILLSIFVGFAILQLFRALGLSSAFGGRSTLHVDDEEEYDVLKSKSSTAGGVGTAGEAIAYGDTVALCGPCGAGKTRLFHTLCFSQGNPQQGGPTVVGTVMSMKASAGHVYPKDRTNDIGNAGNEAVRLIDYPGHPALRPKLASVVSASSRLILTLDSTRPIAEGAAILHSILTDVDVVSGWRKTLNSAAGGEKIPILVACTKSDISKSKNWRRMKIQMRTELERLEKIGGATAATGVVGGNTDENMQSGVASFNQDSRLSLATGRGGALDLDDLGEDIPAALHFLSVGADEGLEALKEFVKLGIIPSAGK